MRAWFMHGAFRPSSPFAPATVAPYSYRPTVGLLAYTAATSTTPSFAASAKRWWSARVWAA